MLNGVQLLKLAVPTLPTAPTKVVTPHLEAAMPPLEEEEVLRIFNDVIARDFQYGLERIRNFRSKGK